MSKYILRRASRTLLSLALIGAPAFTAASAQGARFAVTIAPSAHAEPLTGRLVVVVSKTETPEPRMTISPQGSAIFGVDLNALRAGDTAVVDAKAVGYPSSLAELPPGEYYVQALVNVYKRTTRSDGHTVWLPLNDGRQEVMQIAGGNLYGEPKKVRITNGMSIPLSITKVIPVSPRPADTEWVKRASIQSARLTKFWGRPTFIHATVLLPRGYAENVQARYPTVYTFGHNVPFSFSTDSTRARGRGTINPVTGLESGYDFSVSWRSDNYPRFLAVSFEQQTPYFPDSYSVNSANNGPYGDAMIEEVIPELERRFRMIGKPYARLVEGASTGGWQSLALQLRNPDFFGGAWVLQPDPIDFRRYQQVDIYKDTNAFYFANSQFTKGERFFKRTVDGLPIWTLAGMSRFEEVLGSRVRGAYQLTGWEAIYGPVGSDGYPKPLWDKLTGKIDPSVAEYMRANGYDLREYAERNWATIGPKLAGKLHFFAGDMDDFYLNLAVYRFEEFAKAATNPRSDAEFTYGRPTKGHSWHAWTWGELVRIMGAHVKKNAPAGENTSGWNY
jgi:hypothetical protein